MLALTLLSAAGCNSQQPEIVAQPTVSEVLESCKAYLGKAVRVAGYLGDCAGYDCHLFSDKAEKVKWDRYIAAISQPRIILADLREPEKVMSVGFTDEAWDRKAEKFQQSYVVVSGRMDETSCDGRGGTDRSPGIEPTDIRAWTPAEGAPAN
ncbi:hypothetical protein NYR55_14275 [Sphingomonas sp. BGYR3]|uniref:hypothetical protein n=1 Tax=Sphingomonas sp. BGYR3 TaxID=2975483 RepID=UPI0021A45903|nr:hypothetical protein [Sphingomonas sp. BGYR3]MDG5489787.1 hypothetical protein [Sphingomonas sp. BGYR3]